MSIPGVGPGGGAVVAVLFFKFIKILKYEIANPGQDEDSAAQAAAAAVMAKKGKSLDLPWKSTCRS